MKYYFEEVRLRLNRLDELIEEQFVGDSFILNEEVYKLMLEREELMEVYEKMLEDLEDGKIAED